MLQEDKAKYAADTINKPDDDNNQCIAYRTDRTQCVRRKKIGGLFCGVHCKKFPDADAQTISTMASQNMALKVTVWIQEILGIPYYFDDKHNVYDTKQVLENISNPAIIGRWKYHTDDDRNDTGSGHGDVPVHYEIIFS